MKNRMITFVAPLAIALFLLTSCTQTARVPSAEIPDDVPDSFVAKTDPLGKCECSDHQEAGKLCIKCGWVTLPAGGNVCVCSYALENP